MISIIKATPDNASLLTRIGRQTFIESHGHSAKASDIDAYVNVNFTPSALRDELSDSRNIYHIIYYHDQPAGYSKIRLNSSTDLLDYQHITKLDRLYLLKDFYRQKLGLELFRFNVALSKQHDQAGMWLYVWKENTRAANFYTQNGFRIIGSHDFKISETHSNPNHQLFLAY